MAIAGARDQLAALKEENERLKKQIEHDSHATELGNTWLRDSSLETWFPYTREEIDSLKAKIAELEKDSK